MSEQTIPLRIADLAVAACNAEITKLQEDNARLKAEVERLTKAGDAMKFDCLNYLRELEKRPFWFPLLSQLEVNHKSVQAWNAAKEGKQP
jgi:hypothetical protein